MTVMTLGPGFLRGKKTGQKQKKHLKFSRFGWRCLHFEKDIYPGIPKTPVFGVVHGKTPDFGVVRERPQKCNLRFFNKIWYTGYVMKTWRFIIQEPAFFCHGS